MESITLHWAEYVAAWIPIVAMLAIFGYYVNKLVRVQRSSVEALQGILQKMTDIDNRLATWPTVEAKEKQ